MFLGIELASWVGAALGLVFLAMFFAWRHERTERRFVDSLCTSFQDLANNHWASYREAVQQVGELKRQNESVGQLLTAAYTDTMGLEIELEIELEDAEEELEKADDLLEKADELRHTFTDLLTRQERQIDRARSHADIATNLALRLAQKLDSLGVEMTDEERVGWSGAVEHR